MNAPIEFKAELPIEVQAGQSLVLEIRARPGKGSPATGTGSFDVQLNDANGAAVTGVSAVYLIRTSQTYSVPLDPNTGHGRLDNIAAGIYRLSLTGQASDGTGSFDVQLIDADGHPVTALSSVTLGGAQSYTVPVDSATGHGRLDGIAPGIYTLTAKATGS